MFSAYHTSVYFSARRICSESALTREKSSTTLLTVSRYDQMSMFGSKHAPPRVRTSRGSDQPVAD